MRKISLAVAGILSGLVLSSCVATIKPEKMTQLDSQIETVYNENQKVVSDVKNSFSYRANTDLSFPVAIFLSLTENVASFGGTTGMLTGKVISTASTISILKNGFGVKVLYEDESIKTKDCRFVPVVWARDEKLYHELFVKKDWNRGDLNRLWFANILVGKMSSIPIVGWYVPWNNYGVKFVKGEEKESKEVKNKFKMFVFDGDRGGLVGHSSITYIGRVDVDGKPARMFLMTGAYNGYAWEEMRRQISQVCIKDRE